MVIILMMDVTYLIYILLVFLNQLKCSLISSVDEFSDLFINQLCRRLTVWLLKHSVSFLWEIKGDLSDFWVHPKFGNLCEKEDNTKSLKN